MPTSLRDALKTLRARWRLILLVAAVPSAIGGYFAYTFRPEYRASGVIRIADTRRAVAGSLGGGMSDAITASSIDPVLSSVQELTSRGVAGQVVDSIVDTRAWSRLLPAGTITRLELLSDTISDTLSLTFGRDGFRVSDGSNPALPAKYGDPVEIRQVRFVVPARPPVAKGELWIRSREDAIDHVLSALAVKPRPQTDVIDVAYTDRDRQIARRAVNTAIAVFQRSSAVGAQQQSRLRRTFLQEQLQKNGALLKEAQRALSEFRSNAQFYSSKERLHSDQAGMASIDEQQNELQADRRALTDLLALLDAGDTSATALTAIGASQTVAANPVIAQLYTQLLRYKAVRDSLTEGPWGSASTHPDVMRQTALIRGTKAQLTAAVRNMLASLDARQQSLQQFRARNQQAFQSTSGKEVEEAQLEQQVEGLRTINDQLNQEFQKAQISEAAEAGEVQVIDWATVPPRGIGIGPVRRVAFGVLLGLMLGVIVTFLAEHLNRSIRRPVQLEAALQVPGLAVIPAQSVPRNVRAVRRLRAMAGAVEEKPAVDETVVAAADAASASAEAYRHLRTNLLFSQRERPPKTVLVTSPAPGDGKTTVAANLVVTFCQQGMRGILVDCDLRRGRLHALFDVPREPGISDVLERRVDLDAAIRSTNVPGLDVLPMGTPTSWPAELLGSSAMAELLAALAERYGIVVLDSAPVLAATDAVILSTRVEAALLVVRAARTDEDEARHALQQLLAVGAPVVGAVLNDQHTSPHNYQGYAYRAMYTPQRSGAG
jgi:capsular exopolysaccharide synthesis family protein